MPGAVPEPTRRIELEILYLSSAMDNVRDTIGAWIIQQSVPGRVVLSSDPIEHIASLSVRRTPPPFIVFRLELQRDFQQQFQSFQDLCRDVSHAHPDARICIFGIFTPRDQDDSGGQRVAGYLSNGDLSSMSALASRREVERRTLSELQHLVRQGRKNPDTTETPPPGSTSKFDPSSPAEISARIAEVADSIAERRINAAGEYVETLREVAEQVAALETARSPEDPISDPQLRELLDKALQALGALFERAGTEMGTKLLISGATAGILGTVAGGSTTAIFAMCSAAWLGPDAFKAAVAKFGGATCPISNDDASDAASPDDTPDA